jgi:hypothetical protein
MRKLTYRMIIVALAATVFAPPLSALTQQELEKQHQQSGTTRRPTVTPRQPSRPSIHLGDDLGLVRRVRDWRTAPYPRTILVVTFIMDTSPGSTAAGITKRATAITAGGGMWAVPGISMLSRSKVRQPTFPTLTLWKKRPLNQRRRKNRTILSIIAPEIVKAFLTRRLRSARRSGNETGTLASALRNKPVFNDSSVTDRPVLKRASKSRPSDQWSDDDYDVFDGYGEITFLTRRSTRYTNIWP